MKRRNFISALAYLPIVSQITRFSDYKTALKEEGNVRKYWVDLAYKLAFPVLEALSKGELKRMMPVETNPGKEEERRKVTHLEAFGRLLSGLSPWFQYSGPGLSEEEYSIRKSLLNLYFNGIQHAVDPSSPDFMNFTEGSQPLVDTAFLIHAFIKAPILFSRLDETSKQNLLSAVIATRKIIPGLNNWLLFAAIREAFLLSIGEEYNKESIDFALSKHMEWYKGDGIYGDGPFFHWDYYNSFVIQPLMLDLLKILEVKGDIKKEMYALEISRAQRYGEILERLISPSGTFPPIGRSLAYRAGTFQLLSQLALNHQLPDSLPPGQVRSALTAVIQKTMEASSTFDEKGWLKIGLCGHQSELAESYISTGSLYLCSTALLPLGLPAGDKFWTEPARDWTSKKIWSGGTVKPDHAMVD